MNKAKYKLVYNPAALFEYQLYKKVWIFWILVCRSFTRAKIDDYLKQIGIFKVEYFNDKGELINGN